MVGFQKPRPAALEKADRRKALVKRDLSENAKVRERSQGRCEVEVLYRGGGAVECARCERRAVHVHHLIGGMGKRGIGRSALAKHKVHACERCHSDIHGHVLVRQGGAVPFWSDAYRRVT